MGDAQNRKHAFTLLPHSHSILSNAAAYVSREPGVFSRSLSLNFTSSSHVDMLRLQPSEIGLTAADLQTYKRRLEARRRARLQVLNGELVSTQRLHPRIHRGPARSRDDALTTTSDTVALSYSVYDSSGDHIVDDDVQVEMNDAAVSADSLTRQDRDSSSRPQGNRVAGDQNARLPIDASKHSSESMSQLDGSIDIPQVHLRVPQGRRYRPRSWSDPQQTDDTSDLIQPRRRPGLSGRLHERASSARTGQSIEHQSAYQELLLGGLDHPVINQKGSSPIGHNGPVLAAYMALRNTQSPLERVASASKALSRAGPNWQMELPFRLPDPVKVPNGRSIVSDASAGPFTPPGIATCTEFSEDSTPRPSAPRLTPRQLHGRDVAEQITKADRKDQHGATDSDALTASSSISPARTTLCRRNAVHRSRASVDSVSDDATSRRGRDASPVQPRPPSRPLPALIARRTYASPRRPNSSDHQSRQLFHDALEGQKATFFRALARAKGGSVPRDADRRWLSYLEEHGFTQSENYGESNVSDASQPPTNGGRGQTENSSSASPHRYRLPNDRNTGTFESSTEDEQTREHPHAPNFQFAVTRGGRPMTELSTTAIPQRMPHRPLPPFARRQSEQENMEDEELERFEHERRARLRRLEVRRQGDTSGYGADGEDNDEDATPPPLGRLERMM